MKSWLTLAYFNSPVCRTTACLVHLRSKRYVVNAIESANCVTIPPISLPNYVWNSPRAAAEFYIAKFPGTSEFCDEEIESSYGEQLAILYSQYAEVIVGIPGKIIFHKLTYEWSIELAELLTHEKSFWRKFALDYINKSGENLSL